MWKDMFTCPSPKPCHSACMSAASARLTKSISLRVCERVVRSVWVCEEGVTGEESVSVSAGERESLPRRDVPFPHINYWGVRTHWELRGRVRGQETRTPTGLQRPWCPSHTHTHTEDNMQTKYTVNSGDHLIKKSWKGSRFFTISQQSVDLISFNPQSKNIFQQNRCSSKKYG